MATFEQHAGVQLSSLCSALGLRDREREFVPVMGALLGGWGDYLVPAAPPYPSRIGDDHSPYEWSVAYSRQDIELRLLVEAQAPSASLAGNHRAAVELGSRLARTHAAFDTRLNSLSDLFFPEGATGAFTLWHAVVLTDERPAFKAYLNPQAHGRELAPAIAAEALQRLGYGDAVSMLFERVARRGPALDELVYFSLDLADTPDARVKVYFAHHLADSVDIERAFAASPTHRAGDVTDFMRRMLGHEGRLQSKPITSCFSFRRGSSVPCAVNLHLPVAHYVEDDALIAERVMGLLRDEGVSPRLHSRVLAAVARRPLDEGTGIQSYTSLRRDPGGRRITVYLSPELYSSDRSESFGDEERSVA
jgi:DMATS type aromatic prenyltransferase